MIRTALLRRSVVSAPRLVALPRSAVFKRGFAQAQTNEKTETNRAEKTLQKFWTSVSVEPMKTGGYAVTLDKKPIKTSLGLPLVVSDPGLAHLLAQEWSVIASSKIRNHSLPLTSLAARAVDLQQGEEREVEKEKVYNHLMPYLDTDTLLVFAPKKDCDGFLRQAQEEQYWPVIEEAQAFWGVELSTLDGDTSLYGNTQSEVAKQVVGKWMRNLDCWKLAALERATMTGKSVIGAMNIVRQRLTADEVADLINLETIHQTQLWGEVEDTHDVLHADLRRHLGSAYIVAKCT